MEIPDALLKNRDMIGDVAAFASDNPQIAKAAIEFLGSGSCSGGGLESIVAAKRSRSAARVPSSATAPAANASNTMPVTSLLRTPNRTIVSVRARPNSIASPSLHGSAEPGRWQRPSPNFRSCPSPGT